MRKEKLCQVQTVALFETLQKRFEKNKNRHQAIKWSDVQKQLEAYTDKLWSLNEMEKSGGEPDVVGLDGGQYIFMDCVAESPKGRRSLCYDEDALESRKQYKPEGSALGMAKQMGIHLLNEEEYRYLQSVGQFDTKTSSWLATPQPIRERGGAIFGDWRYGQVFIYHNGAESYYGSRGFRGVLKV